MTGINLNEDKVGMCKETFCFNKVMVNFVDLLGVWMTMNDEIRSYEHTIPKRLKMRILSHNYYMHFITNEPQFCTYGYSYIP